MHCRLIKNNQPISDFTWLNELDIAKDCDHGIPYNNPTAATAFLGCISDVEKARMSEWLTGTCMVSNSFLLLWMVVQTVQLWSKKHYINIFFYSSEYGKIVTQFVCIGEPNSTSSANL